jgi:hypothetical protein
MSTGSPEVHRRLRRYIIAEYEIEWLQVGNAHCPSMRRPADVKAFLVGPVHIHVFLCPDRCFVCAAIASFSGRRKTLVFLFRELSSAEYFYRHTSIRTLM